MNLNEQVKNHPVVFALSAGAVGATLAWAAFSTLVAAPKDDRISLLRDRLATCEVATSLNVEDGDVFAEDLSLKEREATTTSDGQLLVLNEFTQPHLVRIETSLPDQETVRHEMLPVGGRIDVESPEGYYYRINILEIADDSVRLRVVRPRTNQSSP